MLARTARQEIEESRVEIERNRAKLNAVSDSGAPVLDFPMLERKQAQLLELSAEHQRS